MHILVVFPNIEVENEFVDRIVSILQRDHTVKKDVEAFWEEVKPDKYDLIILNWPETCFKKIWKQITQQDYESFVTQMQEWQDAGTKVLSFRHNIYRHNSVTPFNDKLYDYIYTQADGIIHLGKYSLNHYNKAYPTAVGVHHGIIPHPLYHNFDFEKEKRVARKELKIPQRTFFCLVPGWVRSNQEVDLAIQIFNKIRQRPARLVFMNVFKVKPLYSKKDIRFYFQIIKEFYDRHFKGIYLKRYVLSSDAFSRYVAAADLLILPRTGVLNSGNLTMAAQFGKLLVGPSCGNLREEIERFGFISFGTDSVTISEAELNLQIREKANLDFTSNLKKQVLIDNSDCQIKTRLNGLIDQVLGVKKDV